MSQTRGETTEQLAMDRLHRFRAIGREVPDLAPPVKLSRDQLIEKRSMCPHICVETGQSWVKEYHAAASNWKRCQLGPNPCMRRWKWIVSETKEIPSCWAAHEDDTKIKVTPASSGSVGSYSASQPASSQAARTASSSSSTASTVRNISIATPRIGQAKARAAALSGQPMTPSVREEAPSQVLSDSDFSSVEWVEDQPDYMDENL
jgi:hypothetical protein